jgi:hypothetical protein
VTFRIVSEGYATLHEIRKHWTGIDVLDALDYLDCTNRANEFHRENSKKTRKS